MSRKRSAAPSPFSASLLDLMTCALGATILIFVMKQAVAGGKLAAVEADAAHQANVAGAMLTRLEVLRDRIEEIHDRQLKVAAATPFGLPPIEGDLCILIDGSGSMDWNRNAQQIGAKAEVAVELADALMRSSLAIDAVRVVRFSDKVDDVTGWRYLPSSQASRKSELDQLSRVIREQMTPRGGGTDLVSAIVDGLSRVRPGSTQLTVVLFSDGQHQVGAQPQPATATARSLVEQAGRDLGGAGHRLTIHAVGLFDRVGTRTPPLDAAAFAYSSHAREYFGDKLPAPTGAVSSWTTAEEFYVGSGLTRAQTAELIERGAALEIGEFLRAVSGYTGGRYLGVHVDVGAEGG